MAHSIRHTWHALLGHWETYEERLFYDKRRASVPPAALSTPLPSAPTRTAAARQSARAE